MSTPSLTQPRAPWVIITRTGDPWITTATTQLQDQGGAVVRLNGPELTDKQSLFTAFAHALDFPGYFGHNWDALVDCLRDWHGHGTDSQALAVVIDHADPLAGTDYFSLLISVLAIGAWNANLRLDADGEPFDDWPAYPLHFVLLLDHTDPATLAEPDTTDEDVVITLVDGRLHATLDPTDWPHP